MPELPAHFKPHLAVGPPHLRQAVLTEHPLEPAIYGVGGRARKRPALQDEAAVVVGEGKQAIALTVAE